MTIDLRHTDEVRQEMTHVDDWLEIPATTEGEGYAKEFLNHSRQRSIDVDYEWLAANPIFCTYRGKRYRCTGASRLGDVWLTSDFSQAIGYQKRVDVVECSDWGKDA